MDGSVCVTAAGSGETFRLTEGSRDEAAEGHVVGLLRPEAVVWSPDGSRIAYMRGAEAPRIWVLDVRKLMMMMAETGSAANDEKLLRKHIAASSRCL